MFPPASVPDISDRDLGNELGQTTCFMMLENPAQSMAQLGPIATSHVFSPFRTQQISNCQLETTPSIFIPDDYL